MARIIYITQSLEKGGTEKQLSIIAARTRIFGHEAIVVALSGGGWWESYLLQCGVSVFKRNFPSRILRLGTLFQFLDLVSLLKKHKPDVVVSFLYTPSILGSIAAKLAKVPVIIASRRDCGFQRKEAPFPKCVEKYSYAATNIFVANSEAVRQSLHDNERLDLDKIRIIYNGIDCPVLSPEGYLQSRKDLGIPEHKIVVGMVANFWPHKNHMMFVRAAKKVLEQESNVLFVLAGGYWEYQKEVESEIIKLGLKDDVRLIGQIESASNIMPGIDIGVLCSESEGFSNTILEYMSYGKPVVATRVGGNQEAVLDGETGYLVPWNDHAAMADALLALIRHPEKRFEMGRLGRNRVESEYNWKIVLNRWNELFCSFLYKQRTANDDSSG